jgi:hypothetical protein
MFCSAFGRRRTGSRRGKNPSPPGSRLTPINTPLTVAFKQKSKPIMKHPRLSAALGLLGLACVGSMALHPQKAAADPHGIGNPLGAASQGFFQGFFLHGASYLTTITTTTGAFEARGVLTFHADSTVSATSSAQGAFSAANWARGNPTAKAGWSQGPSTSTSLPTRMWRAWIGP